MRRESRGDGLKEGGGRVRVGKGREKGERKERVRRREEGRREGRRERGSKESKQMREEGREGESFCMRVKIRKQDIIYKTTPSVVDEITEKLNTAERGEGEGDDERKRESVCVCLKTNLSCLRANSNIFILLTRSFIRFS